MGRTSSYLLILKTLQCLSHRPGLVGHINLVLLQGHVQIISITDHIQSSGLCFVTRQFADKL